MTDFEQIIAPTPNVIPATQEVVYDKYWLSYLRIEASEPTRPVRLIASFAPARDVTVQIPQKDSNGNPLLDSQGAPVVTSVTYKELMPNVEPKRLVIEDLFVEAASDPTGLGTVMNMVISSLRDKAIANGILV